MTSQQKITRGSFVRQPRSLLERLRDLSQRKEAPVRKSFNPASVFLPVEPRSTARRTNRQAQGGAASQSKRYTQRNGYDISLSLGRAVVRAPALNIPQFGPRWVSATLTLILGFILFAMWTASPFTVTSAIVRGNLRLSAEQINSMLGTYGQPIFKAVPARIIANLHAAFSDLQEINVHVQLPNRIIVDVVERAPVLAWYQDGVVTWIDASGVAFMPRGEVPGMVVVAANGSPALVAPDPALPLYEQKFIDPAIVQALTVLARDVPTGMTMIFDPVYGMGWQDPRGWTVYFGQDSRDIPMKNVVYNAIVDTLTQQGIQPSLISVEYLDAPFYK
jgi:cell division septal protein FtsQ